MQMAFYYLSKKKLYTAWMGFFSQYFTAEENIYKYVLLNTSVDILLIHVSRDFQRQLVTS